jgi:hypothetical protein
MSMFMTTVMMVSTIIYLQGCQEWIRTAERSLQVLVILLWHTKECNKVCTASVDAAEPA